MTDRADATSGELAYRRYRPSLLMRSMLRLADRLTVGRLDIVFPDGSRRSISGLEPGPRAELRIHRNRLARRYLVGGKLGFCEGYIDGDWSSPDVEALFTFFLLNEDGLASTIEGRRWYRAAQHLQHLLRPNDRRGAKRNIAAHYDLGNAFYETWLDPSMTYSSALFDAADTALETAQAIKYERLARIAGIESSHHVLEIGCGWGGFAEFAASRIGAKVTAITISQAQHDYAAARIQRQGLGERVEIRLQDYRETQGAFDRIASIEMFEAVGEKWWSAYFRTLRDRLKPGGAAALQIITIADRYFDEYRRSADYIQKYIFPGGMLPSPGALEAQIERAGLALRSSTGFAEHYARTLRHWNQRFQAAWPDIHAMGFDVRFKRMWEQYLHYCAAGFGAGTIDVRQLAVARA